MTDAINHFGPFMDRAPETQGVVIQTVSTFFLSILEEQNNGRSPRLEKLPIAEPSQPRG